MLVCITPAWVNTTHADDAEDLLSEFNIVLDNITKRELEDKIDKIESDIEEIRSTQERNATHNKILSEYISQFNERVDLMMNDINVYQKQNEEIASLISDVILTADITTLLKYDSAYKTNQNYINELLVGLNDYTTQYNYRLLSNDISTLSDLELELSDVKVLYSEKMDNYNLGDVFDIKWILPNERKVLSHYGYRIDPSNQDSIKFHTGTDYYAEEGTPIGALFNGEVISCGWSNTNGYFVAVMCGDNVKYFISHCSEIYVKEGDKVKQYDVIASTGNSGERYKLPRLHLAIYINGVVYDVNRLFE